MKKNYFNLPIELFKQMLTRNLKLNLDEDDAANFDFFEYAPNPAAESRKLRFIFAIQNLQNDDVVKVIIEKFNTVNRSFENFDTVDFRTNSNGVVKFEKSIDTNIFNSTDEADFSSKYKFTVKHYAKGNEQGDPLGYYTVEDNITYNVLFVQYGLLVSSRRAVKFCYITLNDKSLSLAPTINMVPPTK